MIIALTGRAGVGKSTVARALCADHGFLRIGFADPLKAMLRGFYRAGELSSDDIDRRISGDLKEIPDPWLGGISPRYTMQTLGTEWGRKRMGEDFWIGAWERSVGASGAERIVVDDCRFTNEAEAVRKLGGVVIGLRREGVAPLPGNHASEFGTEPDEWIDVMDDFPAATAALVLRVARSIRVHRV